MSNAASPPPSGQDDIEIIVRAYSVRFGVAVRKLLRIEGGFVDDKFDRGGATKYGISLRFLASEGAFDDDGDGKADFDLDMDGDIDGEDIRLLTVSGAVYLYHRCFWQALQCERFPAPISEMLFDQGVNGGRGSAVKLLQRAINQCLMEARAKMGAKDAPAMLKVDGGLGDLTRAALGWVLRYPSLGRDALVPAFRAAARERYRDIVTRYPSQQRFLKGWLARADELGR
ncbi:MAG: glycosyl hydrolase 108 family protein [Pseudomonadota bacterium]|nr:glycosyl hydrolase 108 family protein [Pseudomonadota bacterium]MEE3154561.1 glycosyl hydrolase 108 family protein [Pseudomonadota bacterium]